MSASGVCRLGDRCTGHDVCWEPRPNDEASPDVFANAIPIHRLGDHWEEHGIPPCPLHDGRLEQASETVFANGRGVGRIGDHIDCGSDVAEGSENVFAGD